MLSRKLSGTRYRKWKARTRSAEVRTAIEEFSYHLTNLNGASSEATQRYTKLLPSSSECSLLLSNDVEIGQTVPRNVDANTSILKHTASEDTAASLNVTLSDCLVEKFGMPPTNNECWCEAQYWSAKDSDISAVFQFHNVGMLEFSPGLQTPIISHALQTEMMIRGSEYFQNQEGPFHEHDKCSMPKAWSKKRLAWGEGGGVNRSWLVYSPTKQAAYCFCCLLFSGSSQSSFVKPKGFAK